MTTPADDLMRACLYCHARHFKVIRGHSFLESDLGSNSLWFCPFCGNLLCITPAEAPQFIKDHIAAREKAARLKALEEAVKICDRNSDEREREEDEMGERNAGSTAAFGCARAIETLIAKDRVQ